MFPVEMKVCFDYFYEAIKVIIFDDVLKRPVQVEKEFYKICYK